MQSFAFTAAVLAIARPAIAQTINSTLTPPVDIETSEALSCNGTLACGPNEGITSGVGMLSSVVDIPNSDTNLSLTLVDGNPLGVLSGTGYQFTTQSLYVGAPSDFDLSDQPPSCALMFQYQAQTFPPLSVDLGPYTNTTVCPSSFTGGDNDGCIRRVNDLIRDFRYSTTDKDDSLSSLPKCEALATYTEYNINQDLGFCTSFLGSLVSVTGGALTGPDVSESTARPGGDGECQPVLPQTYQLRNVTSAVQVLHSNSSVAQESDQLMGGRTGLTPIATVQYADDGDEDPAIQYFCMRTYDSDGGELPVSDLRFEGAATAHYAPRAISVILVTLLSLLL